MAVKVMLASAIANGELERRARRDGAAQAVAKPRRRRSSVYDADGKEVFITLMCLKCHKMRPLAQFGLRRMADGAIRNQPWCRPCRSTVSASEARGRRGGAEIAESLAAAASTPVLADAPPADPARPAPKAAAIAAEVAAALAAGLRR